METEYKYLPPKEGELYISYIERILISRENKKDSNNYQEKHHITPKCKGGDNSSSNLIWLYAEEHYYAHKLLALENPSEKGLQLAWWNMCTCNEKGNRNYKINCDEYSTARKNAAKALSESRKGIKLSEEHRKSLCGRGRAVINLTTGEKYISAFEAGKCLGLPYEKILDCCKGKSRVSCGEDPITKDRYIWRYVGEEDKDFGLGKAGKNENNKKRVKCIENNIEYESIADASRKTGISKAAISYDCNHGVNLKVPRRKLHFEFIKDD